jgi:hypothetical protein
MKWLAWTKHFHRTPMATRVADALYEAEKQLLHWDAQADFSASMAAYYAKRVQVLKGTTKAPNARAK